MLDSRPEILTVQEAADYLKLSATILAEEITGGRLQVLKVRDEIRVMMPDLLHWMDQMKTNGHARKSHNQTVLDLQPTPAFKHRWPDQSVEHFKEAYAGSVQAGDGAKSVKIGFTDRKTSGKLRRRAVVFIENRPMVEFAGTDDFDKTGEMVSVIKINGKQIRPVAGPPPAYQKMKTIRYNSRVNGPYASSNLAVCALKNDLETMVQHALLRVEDIETR